MRFIRKRKHILNFIGFICTVLMVSANAGANNYALLVGVGGYPSQPLEGPVNDVKAIKTVLNKKWGFADSNIKTLLDAEATKKSILSALDDLYTRTKSGDNVFIYLSGHGTSSLDRDIRAPLPTTSGAFIPFDVQGVKTREELMKRLIIGRQDLRPRFKQFDDNGRHLFVAIDACYSGNTVRGKFKTESLPTRHLKLSDLVPRSYGEALNSSEATLEAPDTQESLYPYKNTFYLGASGEHEKAEDIPLRMLNKFQTIDNKAHGAFTNTLLEFFYEPQKADANKDERISYAELQQALKERMGGRGFSHTPQGLPTIAQDDNNLAQQEVFFLQTRSGGVPVKLGTESTKQVPKSRPLKWPELRVTLHPSFKNLKADINSYPGVEVSNEAFDVAIRPGANESFTLVSNAGDIITTITQGDEAGLERALTYEKWINDTLLETKSSASGMRLEASFSGVAKGSAAVEGEKVGFDLRLPDGGYLMILDYEPGGYINVIYPYNVAEKTIQPANSRVMLHDLMGVKPPFGRDRIHVVAFSSATKIYHELTSNHRFMFDSAYAKNLVSMLSDKDISKATVTLQMITSAASKP